MRITCPACGNEVVGGFDRPNELSWCSSACAKTHGQPDRILTALREIEAQAAKTGSQG